MSSHMRRFVRPVLATAMVAAGVTAGVAPDAGAQSRWAAPVSVSGAVAQPATYTPAQIAALPETTYPVTDPGRGPASVAGPSLESLVEASAPELPTGKNAQLRVTITVTGACHRSVAFALGELDPSFGDHPAVVVPEGGQIDLVVPGDTTRLRSVPALTSITVAVSAAAPVSEPAGSVLVEGGRRPVVLSAAALARLPEQTLTVSFGGPTGTQTHTETGPPLSEVLLAAHQVPTLTTTVIAVGTDDYAAAVTPAEASTGGRPLLISLTEDGTPLTMPRLVTDGDVKGGRYVSDIDVLSVSGAISW